MLSSLTKASHKSWRGESLKLTTMRSRSGRGGNQIVGAEPFFGNPWAEIENEIDADYLVWDRLKWNSFALRNPSVKMAVLKRSSISQRKGEYCLIKKSLTHSLIRTYLEWLIIDLRHHRHVTANKKTRKQQLIRKGSGNWIK